jgi:type II secretory pathway pseudopilin PulG
MRNHLGKEKSFTCLHKPRPVDGDEWGNVCFGEVSLPQKRRNPALWARSFTVLEVLISVIIIGIGVSAVVAVFLGGRFILKQAENKSRAMAVLATKMEEYLTKSFAGLGGLTTLQETFSGVDSGSLPNDLPVDWKVNISTPWEENSSHSRRIPYKLVEVTASYNDEGANNQTQRRADSAPKHRALPFYTHSSRPYY